MRSWMAPLALVTLLSLSVVSTADAQGTTPTPSSTPAPAADAAAPASAAPADAQATATGAPPPATEVDAGTYAVRLRDLETRVNELKEQIFRSKARLSLLAETVLEGVVGGAQALFVHENQMSSSFKLVKAVYALDGAPIFNKADEAALSEKTQFDVYNGSLVPGEHTLTVNLEYQGYGHGVFTYLQGYRFKVSASHTFTVPENRSVSIRVVGYEKGGPTAPLEERPAIRFTERVSELGGAQPSAAAASGSSKEK